MTSPLYAHRIPLRPGDVTPDIRACGHTPAQHRRLDGIEADSPAQDRIREVTAELANLRERLTALAALEEHIGESCRNASHSLRNVLAGDDPRPEADKHVPDWRTR